MLEIAATLARTHAEVMTEPAGDPRPLTDMLPEIAARIASGTAILLASGLDAPGDGFVPIVTTLARRNPFEVLLVQDAVETAPPSGHFSARIGRALSRGRLGASRTAALLSEHAISFRIVRSDQPEDLSA